MATRMQNLPKVHGTSPDLVAGQCDGDHAPWPTSSYQKLRGDRLR